MKKTLVIFRSLLIISAFSVVGSTAAISAGLVKYKIKNGESIEGSLTGILGDPVRGRDLSVNRKKGNCLACHQMPIPEQSFHGNIGPSLVGVGERYTAGEIRLRIVNPKVINEDTIMPAFYRNSGFNRTLKKFKGKTILSAEEVEDIISYVAMLGEMYTIKSGDTLSQLAQANKSSLKNVLTLNPSFASEPGKIDVGEQIVLPAINN